jgi:outer membrane protein TolC
MDWLNSHRLSTRDAKSREERRLQTSAKKNSSRLRATAVALLGLTTAMPPGLMAQNTKPTAGDKIYQDLPATPVPAPTIPLFLRSTRTDYGKARTFWNDLPGLYAPVHAPRASFMNSVRLGDLIHDGKIYLSLSDALTMALENNYDIAIARYNLDIADTDVLRARAGAVLLGAPSALVTNTLGGASQTLTATGGGPGGSAASAATGFGGISQSADGAGPLPEANIDPTVTTTIQLERANLPQSNILFSDGKSVLNQNTDQYNFGYNQGFFWGSQLQVTLTNSRVTTDNPFFPYSPLLTSVFKAQLTQHLLQGAGWWVNRRLIQESIYDRRLSDSGFRQQVLYTVNQVENIYWALVSAYQDLQSKERALEQSTQVASDDRKQLAIGTMAPLDVITADSAVATDKQALISSQSNLEYQQLIMKQAIARNLNDPVLTNAQIIPTDRVDLSPLPEESESVDDLVQTAFKRRPELEQATLSLKKDQITLRGARNGLLPIVDAYAFYGSSALGGSQSPDCSLGFGSNAAQCPPGTFPTIHTATALNNLFNSSASDKGVGFNVTIPLGNRVAQAQQSRAQLEYRQAQLRLEQLYTQIRMQVVNQKFALVNDRAAVQAAEAAQVFNQQSLDDERKKLKLGASTTALVLQQARNLAVADDNLISAQAAYARDRAELFQLVATTLEHYGINMQDATVGTVSAQPVVPGLRPAKPSKVPTMPSPGGMQ